MGYALYKLNRKTIVSPFAKILNPMNKIRFKKIAILVFFGGVLGISCTDSDDDSEATCGFGNPLMDLAWLGEEVLRREAVLQSEENPSEDMNYCFIAKAMLNGKTVIVYGDCNPVINKIIPILDCNGKILNGADFNALEKMEIIWKPPIFLCDTEF